MDDTAQRHSGSLDVGKNPEQIVPYGNVSLDHRHAPAILLQGGNGRLCRGCRCLSTDQHQVACPLLGQPLRHPQAKAAPHTVMR